ncbi:MAG: hypothetical protein AB1714_22080 [Acidobacteriota bacterium]
MGDKAVVDAGPLIHLWEIDSLSALGVFEELHVLDGVWDEAVREGRLHAELLLDMRNLKRHPLAGPEIHQFVLAHSFTGLQAGELACLHLCSRLHLTLILTDDLAARVAAETLGLTPIGSLGVVVRAFRERIFSFETARQHLLDLYVVSSLFVTRAIVEMAIEQLG